MINLDKNSINSFVVDVSPNRDSTTSNYLFELEFDMTKHKIYFLSTDISTNPDRYNKFNVILVDVIEDENPVESIVYYSTGYGNYGTYTVYEYNGSVEEIDLAYIVKTLEIGKFKVNFVDASSYTASNSVATITSDNSFYIAPVVVPCDTIAYKQVILLTLEDWAYNDVTDVWEQLVNFADHIGNYTLSYKSLNEDYYFELSGINSSQLNIDTADNNLSLGQLIINYPTLPTDLIELQILHNDYGTTLI